MALYDNSIGTTKNFEVGTKVFNNYKTLYDKDDMYIITKKHEPIVKNTKIEMKTGSNIVDKYYKYDLKKIDDEKIICEQTRVFKVEPMVLKGNIKIKIDNEIINQDVNQNIEKKINEKTIKKIVKDDHGDKKGKYTDTGYVPPYPGRHFITFDNDEQVEFTGKVEIIKGDNQEAGKRKSRRNRKSKKGKRSRKARKSRRKSNRRRGRR
tara:strand:- start:82 stop:705 length:624 start_codon:yes stop_codon:yes gene_type:complete